MNPKTRRLLYFTDKLCKKIDMHSDFFFQRVDAVCRGDWEAAEYIEKMMLEPIEHQTRFLLMKIDDSLKGAL
jgi:hypothetical protein